MTRPQLKLRLELLTTDSNSTKEDYLEFIENVLSRCPLAKHQRNSLVNMKYKIIGMGNIDEIREKIELLQFLF